MTVIRWVESTGSTNADLARAVGAGEAAPGDALVAREQTAGRGRLGRSWTTRPGDSLAISMVVEPVAGDWLSLVVGLGVAEALAGFVAARVDLKWPNDVLVGDAKLSGVLGELVASPSGPLAVVGVGVNTAMPAERRPVPSATSLALLDSPAADDERAVAQAVVAAVQARVDGDDAARAAAREAYRERCVTLGRRVRVLRGPEPAVTGEAVAIDDAGRLVVRNGAGEHAFAAGDVEHLR